MIQEDPVAERIAIESYSENGAFTQVMGQERKK